ncbi:hypothetical protein [Bacillus velezensis]|uniref:hypothetical protein n=1 Tax=Bacillus velezensis TaxID=492670 RepID=UPI000CB75255|nr:hypothetical protein [Bacillus velezensis]PJN81889.1 hypothetical protein CV739_24675 [Bacillus velezensis]
MKRQRIDAIVTEKSLHLVNFHTAGFSGADLVEHIDLAAFGGEAPPIKNVCAKVSVALSDRLDEICGQLEISKRQFIEAALIDALAKADEIMVGEGVYEALEKHSGQPKEQEAK